MKKHEKWAVSAASLAWVLLVVIPVAFALYAPSLGLVPARVAFFGCILGSTIWFQAVCTAESAPRFELLDFAFLLGCTALGAFVALTGRSILTTGSAKDVATVLTSEIERHFVGTLSSIAAVWLASRAMKRGSDPGIRLLAIAMSSAVFVFYVVLLMISGQL